MTRDQHRDLPTVEILSFSLKIHEGTLLIYFFATSPPFSCPCGKDIPLTGKQFGPNPHFLTRTVFDRGFPGCSHCIPHRVSSCCWDEGHAVCTKMCWLLPSSHPWVPLEHSAWDTLGSLMPFAHLKPCLSPRGSGRALGSVETSVATSHTGRWPRNGSEAKKPDQGCQVTPAQGQPSPMTTPPMPLCFPAQHPSSGTAHIGSVGGEV